MTLKLLYTCFSPAWGGLEKYALELAVAEQRRGHDLLFACQKDTTFEKEAKNAGIHCRAFPYHSHWDVPLMLHLRKIIKEEGRNTVHVHKSRDLRVVRPAVMGLTGAKLFYSLYMNVPGAKRDLYHRWIYSRMKRIFVSSSELRDSAAKFLPVAAEQVAVLPYGMETDAFVPGRAEEFRRSLGLAPDALVIGVLSRLDPQKGQMDAVRAMPRVLQKFPKAHLLLVGDESFDYIGTEKKRLEEEVAQLDIGASVSFLGYQHDAVSTLQAMDVFLLPSLNETYSLSMILALLCALPAVGTNSGGTPEQLGFGKYGTLVPPQDPAGMAEGIISVLGNMDEAKYRGHAGRAMALELHGMENMLARLEGEYRS
ncbi:MAG: glycosyltransferase family 4 protein [Nitrospinae bacterium]|nr:glycosyltransferase family 4 protein [Nitrospinota bacterium]